MRHDQERRATAAQRIPLETLVEVRSSARDDRAFEAESVDVSGRGMRMRTAYLPALGAPLACRFSDRGRTIVVEGLVAWRNENARGGEFGVKFTALDASGAEALRELCGVGSTAASAPGAATAVDPLIAGTRVRLHLDGLGEPMRARVRDAGSRKVQVASNLAFLQLGRRMNVEDVDHSSRHAGQIESVSVVVDPQSGVPQLVVSLRFDDIEDTPQPSVVDLVPTKQDKARSKGTLREEAASGHRTVSHVATAPSASVQVHESRSTGKAVEPLQPGQRAEARGEEGTAAPAARDGVQSPPDLPLIEGSDRAKTWGSRKSPETELADEASRLRSRLENQAAMMSVRAAAAARYTQTLFSRCSASAAERTAGWLRGAGRLATELRQRTPSKPVRRTAPPPRGAVSVDGHRLRPQGGANAAASRARAQSKSDAGSSARTLRRTIGVGVGSALVVGAIVVWTSHGEPPTAKNLPAPLPGPAPAASATAPQQPAARVPVGPAGVATPSPSAFAVANAPGAPTTKQGIAAEVPLFGKTAMATMEPVPVPPVEATPAVAAAPVVASREEAAERAAAEASANETWEQQEAEVRPEDVKPWGRGRLNLPTIHRVKLDRPGADLRGASQSTGFSVVIPNRRVTEAVGGIAKRDRRISSVKLDHSNAGSRITFRFRDKAPPFRVRLRGDYVEFLISAAE